MRWKLLYKQFFFFQVFSSLSYIKVRFHYWFFWSWTTDVFSLGLLVLISKGISDKIHDLLGLVCTDFKKKPTMKIVIECAPKMNGSFVKESGISCVGILKAYTSCCEKINGMLKVKGCNLQSHCVEQPPPSFTSESAVCALPPCKNGLNVLSRMGQL